MTCSTIGSILVESPFSLSPNQPKFRVGLQHGSGDLDPGEADFDNYRIVIEDSSGDLLSYQAATVSASNTYGGHKIVFSAADVQMLLLLTFFVYHGASSY